MCFSGMKSASTIRRREKTMLGFIFLDALRMKTQYRPYRQIHLNWCRFLI